jgi:hypothetical protein
LSKFCTIWLRITDYEGVSWSTFHFHYTARN